MHFITQSLLLKALGSALINSFWQMAALWLLFVLITGSNKRLSSRPKHTLSLILLLAATIWFMATGIWALSHPEMPGIEKSGIFIDQGKSLIAGIYQSKLVLITAMPWLSTLYLTIIIFLVFRHIGFYLHLKKIREAGLQKIQPRIKLFADTIAARMGIHKKVSVWLSGLVDSPLTIGFFRPIILMPLAMINHLSLDQVEAVLLHELAHIRRNDYLINLCISWAGIVFFFNPFARLLIREIRKEREHCCDDLVLQFQYDPHHYASALLSLEKYRHHRSSLVLAATGRSRQLLLERVRRLTGQADHKRKFNVGGIAMFISCLLFGQLLAVNPTGPLPQKQTGTVIAFARQTEQQPPQYIASISSSVNKAPRARTRITKPGPGPEKVLQPIDKEVWVVAQGAEGGEDNFVHPVFETEAKAFSIETTEAPTSPPSSITANSYPYTQKASFSYLFQGDTSKPLQYHFLDGDLEARQAMENALQALNEINWNEIEKEYGKNGQKLDVVKLKKQLSKSMAGLDWNKMDQDIHLRLNRADQIRIVRQMQEQLQAIRSLQGKDKTKLLQLQRNIRRGQLLLERENLEKELELIDKQQIKTIRRTVVYI